MGRNGAAAALVARFLADADRKLAEVLAAPPTDGPDDFEGVPGTAEDSLDRSRLAYCRLVNRLWRTVQKWDVPAPDGRPWAADALADAYRAHAPQHQAGQKGRKVGTDRSRLERAVFEPLAGAAVEVRPEFRTETVGSRRWSSASWTAGSGRPWPRWSAAR